MPRGRLLSYCIGASLVLHLLMAVGLYFMPPSRRPAPDVVPVELADMPRATDFLEPAPGLVQGGPPPPPPPAQAPRAAAPAAPPVEARRSPAPPDASPSRPQQADSPQQAGSPSPGEPEPPARQSQAQEKPAAGSASEKPSPAAPQPVPSKQAPGNAASPGPAAPKPLKLIPTLGALARAPGEPGGRREQPNKGSAASSGGKAADKGEIVEESGGGVHLRSLTSPEFVHQTWYDSVRVKIELVWVYPMEAAQAGIGGEVTIDFVIERDGSVSSVKLVKSSGYKVLDDEAVRAIRVVGRERFHPIPATYHVANIPIRGRFIYSHGGERQIR
jgi:protein TonB